VLRAVETSGVGVLTLVERELPPVTGSEVRLEVIYCGVCGSDLQMSNDPTYPQGRVLGHEFTGVVSEVGPNVSKWSLGDRVAVLPNISCGGECFHCQEGNENFCTEGGHLGWVAGVQGQGGLADSVVVPETCLFRVPDGVSDKGAAITEPTAVALHAVKRVISEVNEPIVVFGAGPVGLLAASILRHRGFTDISVIETNPARRAVAEKIGFTTTANEVAPENRPPTVIDATGAAAAIEAAIQIIRNRGNLILVGLPNNKVEIDLSYAILHGIDFLAAAGYTRQDFSDALAILDAGAIPVDDIVTDVVKLDSAQSTFQQLLSAETNQIKVLLEP